MLNIWGGLIVTILFICYSIYKYISSSTVHLSDLIGADLIIVAWSSGPVIHYFMNNKDTLFTMFIMVSIGSLCEVHRVKSLKDQVKALKSKSN